MRTRLLAVVALAAAAGAANAAEYAWNWNASPGVTNNDGGAFESIDARYDTDSKQFVWNVVFSNQVTKGYTLAVNDGPNPKGHAGELALLYVDFSEASTRKVTAYAYNGANTNRSWTDGNGAVAGDQAGDFIQGSNLPGWYTLSVNDTSDGKRSVSLSLDASNINAHCPLYPGPNGASEWTGLGFGNQIGLWMHTYTGLSAGYFNNGRICGWDTSGEGWFDASNYQTVLVPLPPAAWAGIGGLAVAGIVGRRRKQAMKKIEQQG